MDIIGRMFNRYPSARYSRITISFSYDEMVALLNRRPADFEYLLVKPNKSGGLDITPGKEKNSTFWTRRTGSHTRKWCLRAGAHTIGLPRDVVIEKRNVPYSMSRDLDGRKTFHILEPICSDMPAASEQTASVEDRLLSELIAVNETARMAGAELFMLDGKIAARLIKVLQVA